NIMGVPRKYLPSFIGLIVKKGYMLLPIIAIIAVLSSGRSPMMAAMFGIYTAIGMNLVAMLIAYILGKQDLLEDKVTPSVLLKILTDSARTALPVVAACAAAGVIVGVITLTGLGLKIAGGILDLAQNKLILTMFFTMIASIVLGMGLPTTANYVITATMAAPALLAFDNVPVVAAHLFVFYFGIVADITPPVALAAYAGAGLAQGNPFKTSIQAVKIAVGAFLIPYAFVLSPVLLMENVTFFRLGLAITTAILGMFCLSTSLAGFIEKKLTIIERVLLFSAGLTLVYAHLWTDIYGIAVLGTIFTYQKLSVRKKIQKTDIPA
ncbi:MAG: TRAP transporter large permease subunit, partial [Bacillota bacterium]|nr:TRAP transporter large permease subunit [Bacillota bacterium]